MRLQMLLKFSLDFIFVFLLDYRIIINMKLLKGRCIFPITSIFQIELRGKQENPLSRGIGSFAERTFLLSGGNLTRSDFEHLSLFQKLQTRFCKYWTSITVRISMTCMYKHNKLKKNGTRAMATAKNEVFMGF